MKKFLMVMMVMVAGVIFAEDVKPEVKEDLAVVKYDDVVDKILLLNKDLKEVMASIEKYQDAVMKTNQHIGELKLKEFSLNSKIEILKSLISIPKKEQKPDESK